MGMPDRERIIAELSERANGAGADAWMTLKCSTAREILALLKEQGARVMTLEEIWKRAETIDPDPVFVEWESGITAWIAQSIANIYSIKEAGIIRMRVWTSRPTEEQMRDTKWEGEDDG